MKQQKFVEVAHSAISRLLLFTVGVFVLVTLLFLGLLVLLTTVNTNLPDYGGYFSSWKLFESPPSAIKKIIRVDGNKVIWIKAQTGEIYSKSFYRRKNSPWKKEKAANFSYTHIYREQFGSCKFDDVYNFEKSFPNPPEKVVQCSRLEEWGGNSIFLWYFALSENGNLWVYAYWEDEFVAFCTLCFTTIGILTLFLAILRFGLRRLKLRLENAQ